MIRVTCSLEKDGQILDHYSYGARPKHALRVLSQNELAVDGIITDLSSTRIVIRSECLSDDDATTIFTGSADEMHRLVELAYCYSVVGEQLNAMVTRAAVAEIKKLTERNVFPNSLGVRRIIGEKRLLAATMLRLDLSNEDDIQFGLGDSLEHLFRAIGLWGKGAHTFRQALGAV